MGLLGTQTHKDLNSPSLNLLRPKPNIGYHSSVSLPLSPRAVPSQERIWTCVIEAGDKHLNTSLTHIMVN